MLMQPNRGRRGKTRRVLMQICLQKWVAMQAFAFIGADEEGAASRFATGFRVLKLRANLLARRGGRPRFSRASVNLEGEGPDESDDDGFHLNGAMVAAAGTQSR